MDILERRQKRKEREKRRYWKYLKLEIRAFRWSLLFFCLLGLLIPLRPKKSNVEKRDLEKFPPLSVEGIMKGDFFAGVSAWYADTFPFRESLLTANAAVESLYGLDKEQIHGSVGTGDEIPTEYTEADPKQGVSDGDAAGAAGQETAAQGDEGGDGAIHVAPESAGTIYIAQDRGFELYYFALDSANQYIKMINNAARLLAGKATVYDIPVPTSIGIYLDQDIQDSLGCSNQSQAFEYILNNLDGSVKGVRVFDTLLNHNSEYLYFRTDHHWTADGAYYAYQQFCQAKGITPNNREDYQKQEFDNFVGSFYSFGNQAAVLAENPDVVTAYTPKGTNDMTYVGMDGIQMEWNVVADASGYDEGSKYSCFIGGDNPYTVIQNPMLQDGSSCLVIKESYGNAFVPFLVDHYQTVHVVDYRYFQENIPQFVVQNQVQDVIFLNNADAVSEGAVAYMDGLFQ